MIRTARASGAPSLAPAAALAFSFAVAFAPSSPAQESDPDVARRLEALEAGQQRIERQLAEIQRLVEGQARPAPAAPSGPDVVGLELDLGDNPVKGEPGAGLVLVEFTDYQ